MKRLIVLFFVLSISICNVFSLGRGKQEFVKAGHWVYDNLAAIMTESGITDFYDETPLTVSQIQVMLDAVDYDALSNSGKRAYDSIVEYFNETNWGFNSDVFSIGVELSVNPEGQYKTNDSLEWIFNRRERSPFIEAQVGLKLSDYVFMGADIPVRVTKSGLERNDTYVNVPYRIALFDLNFPHDAYASAGYMFTEKSGINFRISTLKQELGRSSIGSIILSDNLTDAPNAQLSFFSPYIGYSANITMLGMDRYFYFHNIQIKPHKKVNFSIIEGCLPYGTFDLRYAVPFSIFHGMSSWYDYQAKVDGSGETYDVASFLALKIQYTPAKYLRLYGNFAMNQFQMPNEPTDIPNGLAGQLGLESFIPAGKGYVHFSLEGSYATPYFMITESPNWSYVKTYKELSDESKNFYEWIGSPYGPDSIAAKLTCGYKVEKKWAIDASYLFVARGELSRPDFCGWGGSDYGFVRVERQANWIHPSVTTNEKYKKGGTFITPSGVPEYMNVFSVKADYWLFDWLCFTARPGLAFAFNNNNQEGDFALGFEFAFSVKCNLNKIKK